MKKKWTFYSVIHLNFYIFIVILILYLSPSSSLYSYTGSSIPPMLKMDYGSQSLAMGGASVALENNLFYIDSNPAGGTTLKMYRFSLLHQEWIYDTNYESFSASIGFGKFYIGAGFNYLYTPFQYYDCYGVKSKNTYNISQFLGLLNFGYKIDKWNLVLGTNIKYYGYNVPTSLIDNQSYNLISGDVGAILYTNLLKRYKGYLPSLIFGISIKNIGYSKSLYYLPIDILAGISYRYSNNILISIESDIPIYESVNFSAGVEYNFHRRYFIDAGVKIKENPMFSMGFGYRKKDFRVRVSYSPMVRFYNMINLTVSYSYGETRLEKIRGKVEKLLLDALDYFSKGDYKRALEIVAEALDLEPQNYRAKKLYEIIEKQLEIEEKLEEIETKING